MKKVLFVIMFVFIVVFGIFVHELYHYFTLDKVTGYGIMLKEGKIAYVRGFGYSSEPIAYTIQFVIYLVGFVYLISLYERSKMKDNTKKKEISESERKEFAKFVDAKMTLASLFEWLYLNDGKFCCKYEWRKEFVKKLKEELYK